MGGDPGQGLILAGKSAGLLEKRPGKDPSCTMEPAQIPTMYFLGVSTAGSSMMKIFPAWARELELGKARLVGLDFRLNDDPKRYREAVHFIKHDPLSLGALVTSHKLNLVEASRDLFDELDVFATLMSEVSCIAKDGPRLTGTAIDPITSGIALDSFLPADHWERSGSEVLLLGAGGAAVALTWYLMHEARGCNHPQHIHVTDIDAGRLDHMRRIHQAFPRLVPVSYHLVKPGETADERLAALPAYSLVVNATGMGKDRPGSPISNQARWPDFAYAWELNYRGERPFLHQATAQQEARSLVVRDGWLYFIHGWARVIAEVFHLPLPHDGDRFERLCEVALQHR